MYPHERSLVKRLEGKPFALLGVNSDSSREIVKQAVADENITWRSFWNGGSTGGPISTAWKVDGWPTLVYIDHKGVIRHKNIRNPKQMDETLDAMIKEAEAAR